MYPKRESMVVIGTYMVERLPYYRFRLFFVCTSCSSVRFPIFLASFPYGTPYRLLDSLLRLLFPHSSLLISYYSFVCIQILLRSSVS